MAPGLVCRWPWALALLSSLEQPDVVAVSAAVSACEAASLWAQGLAVVEMAAQQDVPLNECGALELRSSRSRNHRHGMSLA